MTSAEIKYSLEKDCKKMTMLLPITFTSVINFHLVLSSLLVCIQFHIDLCFITIPMRIPSTEKTNNCLWNAANSAAIVSLSLAKHSILRRLAQRRIDSLETVCFQNAKQLQIHMCGPECFPPNLERVNQVTLLEYVSEWCWNGTGTFSSPVYPRQTFPCDHNLRQHFKTAL